MSRNVGKAATAVRHAAPTISMPETLNLSSGQAETLLFESQANISVFTLLLERRFVIFGTACFNGNWFSQLAQLTSSCVLCNECSSCVAMAQAALLLLLPVLQVG